MQHSASTQEQAQGLRGDLRDGDEKKEEQEKRRDAYKLLDLLQRCCPFARRLRLCEEKGNLRSSFSRVRVGVFFPARAFFFSKTVHVSHPQVLEKVAA